MKLPQINEWKYSNDLNNNLEFILSTANTVFTTDTLMLLLSIFLLFQSVCVGLKSLPSTVHPGAMQGWKSWVCGHGTVRSSCAFNILCLICRPFSQVAVLHADQGDHPE